MTARDKTHNSDLTLGHEVNTLALHLDVTDRSHVKGRSPPRSALAASTCSSTMPDEEDIRCSGKQAGDTARGGEAMIQTTHLLG
ncbi:hypothetical protein [Rhizobium mesoamericanum]|nr:hypothetical protein [Rhizobium mesoamericanum]